jgi:small subunit ribosomal protein S3Ae
MPKTKRTGKVKDKWREKRWVVVEAPASFGNAPVAYIPLTDVETAVGRVVEATLFDLVKEDPQQYSIKLHFQIERVEGDKAFTVFKGHEYSREYLRSLIRRGSSMVNLINDYKTMDGTIVRVATVAFAQGRLNSSRKHIVRLIADRIISERCAQLTYEQFTREAVLGKIGSDIYNEARKVAHFRHINIRKTKLIRKGEGPEEGPKAAEVVPEIRV